MLNFDPSTEAGLASLNKFLSSHTYLDGYASHKCCVLVADGDLLRRFGV
jgi:hypothetical protein